MPAAMPSRIMTRLKTKSAKIIFKKLWLPEDPECRVLCADC